MVGSLRPHKKDHLASASIHTDGPPQRPAKPSSHGALFGREIAVGTMRPKTKTGRRSFFAPAANEQTMDSAATERSDSSTDALVLSANKNATPWRTFSNEDARLERIANMNAQKTSNEMKAAAARDKAAARVAAKIAKASKRAEKTAGARAKASAATVTSKAASRLAAHKLKR